MAGNRAVARLVAGASRAARPAGGGQALPTRVLRELESSFGESLGDVRVHEDGRADALGTLAFTAGSEIHFGRGRYDTRSDAGRRLLGHEVAHVLQQRAGRVPPAGRDGVTVSVDRTLEAEAEAAGARAARRERVSLPRGSGGGVSPPVLQPRLGFELELLALVDIDGRPPEEKTKLGTYGAHNLTLTVDHGPEVEGTAPTSAASAAYDLPGGWRTRMAQGTAPADPRTGLRHRLLDPNTWAAATVAPEYARPPAANGTHLNNAPLALIDGFLPKYQDEVNNWDAARATGVLDAVIGAVNHWEAANPAPSGHRHPHRSTRHQNVAATLTRLRRRARRHKTFWAANPQPPAEMQREYQNGGGAWSPQHPVGPGMGGDKYASILEIVTPGGLGYEPEKPSGRVKIIAAVTEAVALANAIDVATGGLTNRVRLNTIGATVLNPETWVGNAGPTRSPQTVDASIQATFAIDLAQMASLFKSLLMMMNSPQTLFTLKHESDPLQGYERARTEIPRAAHVAAQAINDVQVAGGGRPSLVNLRGLITLMAQYLLMGRYFYVRRDDGTLKAALDKNVVALLSRSNLSRVYREEVTAAEKAWVTNNLNVLQTRILARANRTPGSRLFTDATEAQVGPNTAPYNVSCTTFVSNVLTTNDDGITRRFGGFKRMRPETVDPQGRRDVSDARRRRAKHREGPVLEMRNLVPWAFAAQRFPPNQWVALATHITNMLAALNARSEATATHDVQFQQATGALQQQAAPW
jgi:hypothetical protein